MDTLDLELGTPTDELVDFVHAIDGDVVVLGAGGKMGLHFCLQLEQALRAAKRPGCVIAVSRFQSLRSREVFERNGIQCIPCDLRDTEALARLPDSEAVYYLAGVKFGTSDTPELLHEMNVRVPRMVAARYRDARIVALSTGCVYPYVTPASGGSKETDAVDPPGAYAQSCRGREEAFEAAALEDGTRSVLIRLSYACEYRYGVLVDVATKVLKGEPIVLQNGYANVIWQAEAVDQIARSLLLADNPPSILNITGSEVTSIRALAEAFGKRLRRPVAFEGEEAETAWLFNTSKAIELLGPAKVTVDEMIERTAQWLEAGGETWDKPTKFEVRDGQY